MSYVHQHLSNEWVIFHLRNPPFVFPIIVGCRPLFLLIWEGPKLRQNRMIITIVNSCKLNRIDKPECLLDNELVSPRPTPHSFRGRSDYKWNILDYIM